MSQTYLHHKESTTSTLSFSHYLSAYTLNSLTVCVLSLSFIFMLGGKFQTFSLDHPLTGTIIEYSINSLWANSQLEILFYMEQILKWKLQITQKNKKKKTDSILATWEEYFKISMFLWMWRWLSSWLWFFFTLWKIVTEITRDQYVYINACTPP